MSSSESPASQPGDMDQDEKPRVLVDGPGGADTKQGAKIACLECRSAKIKCSAPTDGQVPCKRCVKHQRECLFEKHKRGRKPNKRFSVPSDLRATARNGSESNSFDASNRPISSSGRSDTMHTSSHHKQQQQQSSRNGCSTPDKAQRKHDPSFGSGEAANRHHFADGNWKSSSNFGPAGQALGAPPSHYPDERFHAAAEQYSNGGMTASVSAPSGLAQSGGMPFAYAQSHHHPQPLHPSPHHHHQHQFSHQHSLQQHQHPLQQPQPSSSHSHGRHASDHPSPNHWRDHPQPQAVSSPHSSHSAAAAAKQHDSYTHGRNRPYAHNVPAPSHSYAHWDSQLGSERASKGRLEMSPSRRTSASGAQNAQPHKASHYASATDNGTSQKHKSALDHRSASKGRTQRREGAPSHHHRPSSRGGAYDHDADEEFDDEQDELEDDADATREEHDYVLSNPLKLLAQASDAAAARIEGGRFEPGNRSSLAAVETMGLLHPTLPSSRMATSAAVNLTGLGRPLYGRREDDFSRNQRGWPSNRLLPPILNASRGVSSGEGSSLDASSHAPPPPFLKDSMRSKSFPENELPRIEAPTAIDEPEPTVPAAAGSVSGQISAAKTVSGVPLGRPNVLTPSTLDHEAWEYREGKAQARRGYGSSPGGISADAVTTGSSGVSAGAANAQRQGTASGIHGASPGEIIESPADEVTTAMIGKRKRGRSRAARGGGLPSRRRKLTEWDTDAENGEGADEEAIADTTKGKQVTIATLPKPKEANGVSSGGEGEAGASRKGYFNLSLFHSKNDDTEGLDPVELGLVEIKELERLFDIFFARINPVLDLFDPFLHSVAFVRMRSAFLTTVISSMAARFSDTPQDAKLASTLDKHWQEKLLPMILLGGYKSVEISQAFLILTTYSRPTNRLVDDRSWQYLGFAIRTATEVGVNRKVTPSENLLGNEQVARRVRNRERLWFNLFLYDRTLSAQTGRPWTISEDRMIVQSSMWHRQDFALPEDVSLVSLIKLRRITAQHTEAFDTYLTSPDRFDETQTATALGVGGQSMFDRRLAGLEFFRKNANADLEKWKETWCINTEDKIKEVDTSTAAGKYLVRWAPTAKLFYYHSRLLINSLVLGATEQYEGFISGSSVSVDCWTSAISLIDTVLNDFTEEVLVTWSNDRVVMAVYAAVSAVRMTNLQHKYAFADKETLLALVRRLATSMTSAGKTPRHRNGSATPYGRYLRSVLAAFEPENPSVAVTTQPGAAATGQTPGKDSEHATSITTSSLGPGDSRSAAATPLAAAAADIAAAASAGAGAQESLNNPSDVVGVDQADKAGGAAPLQDGLPAAVADGAPAAVEGMDTADAVLKTEDLVDGADAVKPPLAPVSFIVADGSSMDLDLSAAAAQMASSNTGLDTQTNMDKLLQMPMDGTGVTTNAPCMLTPAGAAVASDVAWPAAAATGGIARPSSSSHSSSAGVAGATNGLLTTPSSNLLLATPISPAGMEASEDPVAAAAAAAAVAMPDVVDDPESLERMWNYMTAFEHTSFWQPQSTWNLSGGGTNAGPPHHGNGH